MIPEPPPIPSRYNPEPFAEGNHSILQNLLQKPGRILYQLTQPNAASVYAVLAISSILCLAVFGFLLGTFSGQMQLWASPAKVLIGLIGSALICFPSLYIFCCLSGMEQPPGMIAGLLLTGLSITAMLLLGFAPVIWVFSQSSNSAVFLGVISLIFYFISLAFGLRLILEGARRLGSQQRKHLWIWMGIFTMVTLQMTSSLRPLIGKATTFLPQEKKFFLQHWFESFDAAEHDTRETTAVSRG